MKIEFLILLVTAFVVLNIYKDGEYLRIIRTWKKYYHMAFYGFIGLSLYVFLKKYPLEGKNLLTHANTFVKYMPMDKESGQFISPLLKLSSRFSGYNNSAQQSPYKRMMESGHSAIPTNTGGNMPTKSNVKRSVSETKKKFIAANQNWKCANCSIQLPAWFEVDHKIRLDRGGDNHVNNLEALCRDCHGKKTAMESML